jgi:hypothetical protein
MGVKVRRGQVLCEFDRLSTKAGTDEVTGSSIKFYIWLIPNFMSSSRRITTVIKSKWLGCVEPREGMTWTEDLHRMLVGEDQKKEGVWNMIERLGG